MTNIAYSATVTHAADMLEGAELLCCVTCGLRHRLSLQTPKDSDVSERAPF